MTKKWASEAERSRSRRAYQREWRNRRNANRIANEIMELQKALRRSNTLAWQAWDEQRRMEYDR